MSQPATRIISQAPEPIGGGAHTPPSHTFPVQHLGPFDPAARIADLEARLAVVEAWLRDRHQI